MDSKSKLEKFLSWFQSLNEADQDELMQLVYSEHKIKDVVRTLLEMEVKGGIIPDMLVYTQAIRALGTIGDWRHAIQLLRESKFKHLLQPDAYCYGTVINACAEAGRSEEAMLMLEWMRRDDIEPNIMCYTSAAKACVESRQWKAA